MKKVNFKLNKKDYVTVKTINAVNHQSLRYAVIEKSQNIIVEETLSDEMYFFENVVCSKDDRYEEEEELISMSVEIGKDLHGLIKKLGKEHDFKVKHFIRGAILSIIEENQN